MKEEKVNFEWRLPAITMTDYRLTAIIWKDVDNYEDETFEMGIFWFDGIKTKIQRCFLVVSHSKYSILG